MMVVFRGREQVGSGGQRVLNGGFSKRTKGTWKGVRTQGCDEHSGERISASRTALERVQDGAADVDAVKEDQHCTMEGQS